MGEIKPEPRSDWSSLGFKYESSNENSTLGHPWRPRCSQSGREKRGDEGFQVRAKEPLGTDSHRAISKISSGCRLLIGRKKMLCIIVPNRRTVDPEFF